MLDVTSPLFIGSTVLVVAIVEAVKIVVPSLQSRWFPLVALAASAVLGFLSVAIDPELGGLVITVLVTALTAAGIYSAQKALRQPAGPNHL